MTEYHSHIAEDDRKQTVLEHLLGTSDLCSKFASHFNAQELGTLTGLAHDLGKYSVEFQNRLKNNGIKVDHSTAGALECCKCNQPYAAYAVIGHHSGIPDNGSFDATTGSTFSERINRGFAGNLCDYSFWQNELTLPLASRPDWLGLNALSDVFLFVCCILVWLMLISSTQPNLCWEKNIRILTIPLWKN